MEGLTIVDHVNGVADLKARVIRTIGNPYDRFNEDALRMLRAVRFAAQLGFTIAGETLSAMHQSAELITKVSRERIREELFKLVASPYPVKGLVPLVTTGLFRRIFPELVDSLNFVHTLERFAQFSTDGDPLLGMAMLFADHQSPEVVEEAISSLNLSTDQLESLTNAVVEARAVALSADYSDAVVKRLARKRGVLPYAVELFEQTLGTGLGNVGMEAGMNIVLRFRNWTPEELNPAPLVTGKDLIEMGFTPGRLFSVVLNKVETKQLNGELNDREAALVFAKEYAEVSGKAELVLTSFREGSL